MSWENNRKGITVFTPIYNRAYCIEALYKSLRKQTYKNFEWIIIDDGSTDNVMQLIQKWIEEENSFDIIYIRVKNGGKMRAVNKAVRLANAPAFFIVDSDDYITEDALECLINWFEEIKDNSEFAGVSGLRKIKTIDAQYNFQFVDATNLERRQYNLVIDMAECYKTDILRKYPAIEIENEKYLSPSFVWNSIARDGYKLRWVNKVIYICEYHTDGLSAVGPDILTRNPVGWGKVIQLDIECKKDNEFTNFQYYRYYQSVKDFLPLDCIAENLGITSKALLEIVSHKPEVINKINQYFLEHKIKRVALYGMGGEAKRFLQISKDFNIEICYGIDRKPNQLLSICYMPTDKLPNVDAILITNRMGIKEIKSNLENYTKIKAISIQEDILDKSLNYYYSDI